MQSVLQENCCRYNTIPQSLFSPASDCCVAAQIMAGWNPESLYAMLGEGTRANMENPANRMMSRKLMAPGFSREAMRQYLTKVGICLQQFPTSCACPAERGCSWLYLGFFLCYPQNPCGRQVKCATSQLCIRQLVKSTIQSCLLQFAWGGAVNQAGLCAIAHTASCSCSCGIGAYVALGPCICLCLLVNH